MLRTLSAMAASATLAASIFIAIPQFVNASAPVPAAKADPAGIAECELRSWPYYPHHCLRDEQRNAGRAGTVRLVAADRVYRAAAAISAPHPKAQPEAPAGWMMSDGEVRRHIAAGDFIRRTVR